MVRKAEGNQHLVLDAANYRLRRRDALAELATQLAGRAIEDRAYRCRIAHDQAHVSLFIVVVGLNLQVACVCLGRGIDHRLKSADLHRNHENEHGARERQCNDRINQRTHRLFAPARHVAHGWD